MKKYNALLSSIAEKYDIKKGNSESDEEWKSRIIYSICGLMAYASLWDETDEQSVSIAHVKNRIGAIFNGYVSIFPEVKQLLPTNSETLENEICDIFQSCGVVYHCPNRIVSAMRKEKSVGNILFQRGIPVDEICSVSGLGMYSEAGCDENTLWVRKMFGLEKRALRDVWSETVSAAVWQQISEPEASAEYLRSKPPFTQGYWTSKADTDGVISIFRSGIKGARLYFLYRQSDGKYEISPLPNWQIEKNNYIALTCACLSEIGTLPPIEFRNDGAIVKIKLNYLLPPMELCFLKLYSWPDLCSSLPSNFKRKCTAKMFSAIKHVLQDEGYEFIER